MKIDRLKLQNWKSFDNRTFEFKEGINLIEGDNYAGKTSLIQALYYALFNETLYKELTAAELKKEGEKDAMIELDISLDGLKYRIRRNISGDKKISVSSHLYELNDKGEEINEIEAISKKDEELTKIDELILKVSRDYLKNINFIQEDSIYQFLNQPKYKIKDDLHKILQLDYLNQLLEYAEQTRKQLEKELKRLEKQETDYKKFCTEKAGEVENLEQELRKNSTDQADLKKQIDQIKTRLESYAQLESLEKEQKEIDDTLKNLTESENKIALQLEELQNSLDEISANEGKLVELKKKVDMFEKNKANLKELEKQRKSIYDKWTEIERKLGPLNDYKKEYREKQKQVQDLESKAKILPSLEKNHAELKKKLEAYSSTKNKYDDLSKKIQEAKNIIKGFEKGDCPISREPCPVAESLIENRKKDLEALETQKKDLESELSKAKNPQVEFDTVTKEIAGIKEIEKKAEYITTQISELENKINLCEKIIPDKENIGTQKTDIEKKITNISKAIQDLEGDRDEYLKLEEIVKPKNALTKDLENEEKERKDISSELEKVKIEKESKIKEVEEYKAANKLTDRSGFFSEKKKMDELHSKILVLEKDVFKLNASIDSIKKQKESLLRPFTSESDLEDTLKSNAHNIYKVDFFKRTLDRTLKELNERTMRDIKDHCNQMWFSFKQGSTMDSISWDENKFVPSVCIGGFERSIYQLSASERVLVYFSIRASLLAKLGPHYFLVIDNLLGPFMKDNHDAVLSLLKDIIDKTHIKQIIFTGFDVDPKFICDNKITI